MAAVRRALLSERITQGAEAMAFERALAREVDCRDAVAVSSGTTALELALRALGVGPGDEVIVPTLTYVATATVVERCGARVVFADVDPRTLNLDPADVAKRITRRTRGCIAVHFGGHPADVAGLARCLGRERFVVEDACHALGARVAGRPAGGLGTLGCFSFHPAKHVTTGEGGAIVSDDPELCRRLRSLRENGVERDVARFEGLGLPPELREEERGEWVYELHTLGANGRLPEAAAALGRSQLVRLGDQLARRRQLVARYRAALARLPVELPVERRDVRSAWHLLPVRLPPRTSGVRRAEVYRALQRRGIGVQVHYIPVHLQPHYRREGHGFGDFPVAEGAYLRLLSLPLFPGLGFDDVERVARELGRALGAPR
ncbi:MAG: DegT/DnrJ/EryC1/StrS family aminotransferase [Proteobacteria bacterium]|nr:DegT/DnrJ/EryC1/StrS family aminotransferase [Pseudomonadota bacterium]